MENSDILIDEFENADDEHRLSLYMFHRDLRSDFEQIENEEINSLEHEPEFAEQDVINIVGEKDQQSAFVKIKRWCFSILS